MASALSSRGAARDSETGTSLKRTSSRSRPAAGIVFHCGRDVRQSRSARRKPLLIAVVTLGLVAVRCRGLRDRTFVRAGARSRAAAAFSRSGGGEFAFVPIWPRRPERGA